MKQSQSYPCICNPHLRSQLGVLGLDRLSPLFYHLAGSLSYPTSTAKTEYISSQEIAFHLGVFMLICSIELPSVPFRNLGFVPKCFVKNKVQVSQAGDKIAARLVVLPFRS